MKFKFAILGVLLSFVILSNISYAGDYTLINKTGTTVTNIFVSGTGTTAWSKLPVSNSIKNGDRITFNYQTVSEECTFILKFTDSNGREYIMNDVDLCASSEIILTINESTNVTKFSK